MLVVGCVYVTRHAFLFALANEVHSVFSIFSDIVVLAIYERVNDRIS